jgi:hypothetical protein
MWPPMARADQHVLSGLQIILQAWKTPAVPGPAIVSHRAPGRPALGVPSVEQDLDLLYVFELVHQRAPEFALFSCDNDQTEHPLMGGHTPLRADPFHCKVLRCRDWISRKTSLATPPRIAP